MSGRTWPAGWPYSGVVITGLNGYAAAGLRALLQGRWPGMPVYHERHPRRALARMEGLPGCLVVGLLCTRQADLAAQLRVLAVLYRRSTAHPLVVLYEGEREGLPERLPGVSLYPLGGALTVLMRGLLQAGPGAAGMPGLTPRQWQVVRWLSRGLLPWQVARRLRMAEKTVSSHRTGALQRLGLNRHHERLLWALVRVLDGPRHPDMRGHG